MKTNFVRDVKNNIVMIYRMYPPYIPIIFFSGLMNASYPFITTLLSAKIIDQLVRKEDISAIMNNVILMLGTIFAFSMLSILIDLFRKVSYQIIEHYKNRDIPFKAIDMDYDLLERNNTMDLMAKAEDGGGANGGLTAYCNSTITMLCSIASIITAIGALSGLFAAAGNQALLTMNNEAIQGSIVFQFMNSYWSTITLFLCVCISVWINSGFEAKTGKINYDASMKNIDSSRVYWFCFNLIFDYSAGKDIRLFRTDKLIEHEAVTARNNIEAVQKDTLKKCIPIDFGATMLRNAFVLIAYLFVGLKAVYGIISLGELTKYIGMILLAQGQINSLFIILTRLRNHNTYLSNYTKYMNLKNEKYEGTLPVEKRLDFEYELEFKNVSFHYPNSDQMILDSISVKLQVGKKLAIVGPNGAGKTTFIKLLCRLYDPTEGEILLNGINIKKYDYKEYMNLFSVVFQDFKIFSFPLAENVAASQDYDEEKVLKSLEEAGIAERVTQLPKGIHTKLLKDQQEDGEEGIEISGGEKQKVALARALYHEAPIVILDEPTSALDPLAEQDIYERFNSMVQDKTAIFISHRMSSCRFCNDILVFDQGQIVQKGSHNELVKNASGLYYQMWSAQAKYYN